jgi:tetratricopeptide (TPR) repeat protein
MAKAFLKKAILAGAIASLFFSTCISVHKTLIKQTAAESGRLLADGDFQKALDLYKAASKRYPRDGELAGNYLRTIEEIKQAADQALGRHDYARAGSIYRLLLDNYADFGGSAAKLRFKKPFLETSLKYCQVALVDSQAQQAMKAGNFGKALDTYQTALKDHLGDAVWSARYMAIVNEVKAAGDKALGAKDFAQAGRVYALLLKNFPSFGERQPAVAFGKTDLAEGIAVCRDGLTKAGLEEYRKGNLAKAIAVWEDLLAFDPDNAEIKNAVDTARTQLNKVIKK